jgi:hypothetical protein
MSDRTTGQETQMPIAIEEGYVPFNGYQTWFPVTGDLRAKKTPVVILHGPGAAHDYTDAFAAGE